MSDTADMATLRHAIEDVLRLNDILRKMVEKRDDPPDTVTRVFAPLQRALPLSARRVRFQHPLSEIKHVAAVCPNGICLSHTGDHRQRTHLSMGCVKDDDSTITWDSEAMAKEAR